MNQIRIYPMYLIAFLFSFYPSLIHGIDRSCIEKEKEIRQDLYKISSTDLQDVLGLHFEEIPTMTAQELKQAMQDDPNLYVMNVLPASLYNDCHITGSINVPLKEMIDTLSSWDRDKKIIVYCALYECDAGEKAYILLSCMGFTDVTDYRGGIKEWYQLGFPTQGPAEFSYLHAKSTMQQKLFYPELLVCSRQTRWMETTPEGQEA